MLNPTEDTRKPPSNKSHSDGLGYAGMTDAGISRSRSRFSPEAYKWVREYLKLRDCNGGAAKCKQCNRVETEYRIVVHHLNGDERCNQPWNIEFRCDSHHTKGMWEVRKARLDSKLSKDDGNRSTVMPDTLSFERERVVSRHQLGDPLSDERLMFALAMRETSSLELRLNRRNSPLFRAMVKEKLLGQGSRGFLTLDYCMNSLAELIGCSQDACKDYLAKMTSEEGDLYEDTLPDGTRVVRFKESYFAKQDAELQASLKIIPPKNTRSLDEFTKKEAA